MQSLIDIINKNPNFQNKFKAYTPKKTDPTIVLKGVSLDNDITTIVKQITSKNIELTGLDSDIKFLFKTKKAQAQQSMDLVFRVSPKVFQIIHGQLHNHLYIDFQRCTTKIETFVKQCQNCFKFNHKTGECKNPRICRQCGEAKLPNHTCSSEHKCCVNCKNSPNHDHGTDHMPNTDKCPMYLAQKTRLRNNTQYHPGNQHS
ncbi:hypothetical protein QR98_0093210 [Sarcoptes scabiei]|nr:hypothetical protein QR98_0093210 [Sarcoptes scabiei]